MGGIQNKMRETSRIIGVVFLIGAIIVFSACTKTKNGVDSHEFPVNNLHLGTVGSESNGILFYKSSLAAGNIFFVDFKSGQAGPLCAKPECNHDTVECNSYLGTKDSTNAIILGISAFDDEIDYILNDGIMISVWKMNRDGSSHQKIRDLCSIEDNIYPGSGGLQPIIHHGYVFVGGYLTKIVNGIYRIQYKLMAYSLNEKEPDITIFSEMNDHQFGGFLMMPVGDRIYYTYYYTDSNGEDNSTIMQLRYWNIAEHRNQDVYVGNAPMGLYEWSIDENKILFTNAFDNRIYGFDMNNNQFETLRLFGDVDSGFITEYLCGGYLVGFAPIDNDTYHLRVEDLVGNEILDIEEEKLEEETGHSGRIFVGIDKQQFYYLSLKEGYKAESLISCCLEDGNRQILWTVEGRQ